MRRLLLLLGIAAVVFLVGARPAAAEDNKDKKKDPRPAVIAVFTLKGTLKEAPADELPLFGAASGTSLKDLVARMKKAGDDSAVKAVVLLSDEGQVGSAQREEVRQAMAGVRAKGKELYVHADSLSMGDYVLFAGASRISVVPTADVWITGLYGEAPYLRRLLDFIGVQPDYLTCGEYKSAAELFMREGPSPAAERMQNWLLDSIYETDVSLIAKGRGVDTAKVRFWIDNGPYTADKAKEAGLIDAVEQRQDFEKLLREKYGKGLTFEKKYGKKKDSKLDFSSPFAVFKIMSDIVKESTKAESKSAVGIVYVDGAITLGSGEASPFAAVTGAHSSDVRKALDEAARDDAIKAVVLRVDSPGGSAVASEIILDATRRVKAKKPFIVSMGDVAGSGGYYVAAAADTIYADESTITGSIGVVAGKFITTPMWNKLGITFKEYKRGANAGLLSSARPFDKQEHERMQAWMDQIYGVFKGHVTATRGKRLKKPIDELAGGRVYTGRQALELGLVDKIGTLQDAIADVATQAKLTDYDVRVVPKPKNFFERLMEELTEKEDTKELGMSNRTGAGTRQASLVDLALPHLQHLDPQRVSLIKRALWRMQLLQQEGVILMMPEMRVGD